MYKNQFTATTRASVVTASIFMAAIVMSQAALASSGGAFRQNQSSQSKVDKEYELGKSY